MKFNLRLVISILLIGAVFFFVKTYFKRYTSIVSSMTQREKDGVAVQDLLLKSVLAQVKLSFFQLKNNPSIEDENGNILKLFDAISKKVLVYRISQSYCSECNKAQMSYVKTLSNQLGSDKIIVLGSFSTYKDLAIYAKSSQITVPTFNIADSSLSILPMEALQTPYYFLLSKEGMINSVFIARKEIPLMSDAYSKMIATEFSRNLPD